MQGEIRLSFVLLFLFDVSLFCIDQEISFEPSKAPVAVYAELLSISKA
jgi:hypothetical protein